MVRLGFAAACVALLGLALARPAGAGADQVTTFTLDNGMEIVVIEDHRAPAVVHMVWYRAGSADEDRGTSGVAHFLEHLLFKATDTLESGEFSKVVAANGGTTGFEVQYTPAGAGAFSFDVSFVNGDSDESPFSFTIGGSAAAAPTFTQSFAPDTIRADGTATVTFTIDNTANGQAASGLAFSNGLPTGLTVASAS